MMYLEGEELPVDEVKKTVRKAVISMDITPVFCGSAFKNKGVQQLLDAVIDYLPVAARRAADGGPPTRAARRSSRARRTRTRRSRPSRSRSRPTPTSAA